MRLAAGVCTGFAVLAAVLTPSVRQTPSAEPVWTAHHHIMAVSSGSPTTTLATSTARRALGLVNLATVAADCNLDDTVAASPRAWRLAAAGTTGDRVFFMPPPSGQVSCILISVGSGQIQVLEGR